MTLPKSLWVYVVDTDGLRETSVANSPDDIPGYYTEAAEYVQPDEKHQKALKDFEYLMGMPLEKWVDDRWKRKLRYG